MSSITAYETSKGKKCYQVRYRKPDGSTTRKAGFATKKAAEIWAAKTEIDKNSNEYIDASKGKTTVGELAQKWLKIKKALLKPSAYAVLDASYRTHVKEAWGSAHIGKILPSQVASWVAGLSERKSATIVIRAHGVLAGILDIAAADKQIQSNPARGAKLPRKKSKKHRYLSHKELEAFAQNCGEKSTMILMLGYMGLRWGEAAALQVQDIDFARKRLKITRNAVQVDGKIHVGTPKSNESRSVSIPEFLLQTLDIELKGKSSEALVFCGKNDSFLFRPKSGKKSHSWFKTALEKSGINDFSPHDLRHTAASLAVSAGANVKVIQRMLGHVSAAHTLDIYADLFDDDLDEVAVKIDAARASALVDKN